MEHWFMGPRLHDTLAANRDHIMQRWMTLVQGTITPESMPAVELINHLPKFLDEVIAALRTEAGLRSNLACPAQSETAAGHGEQRLRLGFSLDAVVREYGALRDAIVATALEVGGPITFAELQCVFSSTITGIARAVSEYARQRDAEQQRLHNEHVAFIAHELRNPLGSAMTAYDVLWQQGVIPPDSRSGGALGRGLQTMRELVDQALNGARTASGIELRREPIRISELLAEAELAATTDAEGRDITLETRIEHDITIDADRRLLRSALSNIVRNAVKYTGHATRVEIRSHVDGKRAVIEIEDHCGGLPPGKVEAAFAPFVRLTDREPGFGLGLAIAKQSVDAHAGTLRVQNLPGKGCIFVLELPIEVPTG
jgi:signal transduction histidine kinase